MRNIIKILFCVSLILLFFGVNFSFALDYPQIKLEKQDRILILAPHPDDEAIGASGIIQEAIALNIPYKIVYLTNGDSNEVAFIVYKKRPVLFQKGVLQMGQLRRTEAVNGMLSLGVDKKNLIFLGYPDGGTMKIFNEYWGEKRPYKSLLTKVRKVPYKNSKSYGAPYVGESILNDLKDILREFKPNKIFVSHPADINPDHRAFPLFLAVALWDLKPFIPSPLVYPYLIHHRNYPKPRGYHPTLEMLPPEDLLDGPIKWKKFDLTEQQIEKKREAISFYKSQVKYNPPYLFTFARKNELFGAYAQINLKNNNFNSRHNPHHEDNIFDGQKVNAKINYARLDDKVYITIKSINFLNSISGINIFLNSYRNDIDFADMPKYRLNIKAGNVLKIYEKNKPVFVRNVKIRQQEKEIIIEIPLKILENPEYVFACARAIGRNLPADATAWRILELE